MDPVKEEPPKIKKSWRKSLLQTYKRLSHSNFTLLILLGVGLALVFLTTQPSLTGLTIYEEQLTAREESLSSREQAIAQQEAALTILGKEQEICDALSTKFYADLTKESEKQVVLNSRINNLEQQLTAFDQSCEQKTEEIVDSRDKELVEALETLVERQEAYSSLEGSAAKNICCKQRVDFPRINGYIVQNNTISCVETGGKVLNC